MQNDVDLSVDDGIATITLNRPDKMNAFTDAMLIEMVRMLDDCQTRDDVRVVVLTGAGRGFSAGGDMGRMKEKAEKSPVEVKSSLWDVTQAVPKRMADFDKPLLAAVNGAAVGGGLDLALMCDIRLASSAAKFAQTYGKLGLFPGAGGAYYLPRIVGTSRALKMFWTGEFILPPAALEMGLVDEVYPEDTFRTEVTEFARKIAAMPPLSMRFIKRAVYQGLTTDLRTHLDQASSHMALIRTSKDHMEAVAAFKEKRAGRYRGQ